MAEKEKLLYRLCGGFLIGFGLIVPGVSGGVLAMILGLYQPIIAVVAKPFSNWRQNCALLLPIIIGAGLCLLFFSRILEYLFLQYSMPTLYLFLGLVAGSLPFLFTKANQGGFRLSYLISLVFGFSLLFVFRGLPFFMKVPLIFQGVLVALGLVLPGLSASFLLMTVGGYQELLTALAHLNFSVLIPVSLGLIPAAILISQLVTLLFEKWYGYTSYAILGLIVASLLLVFPGLPRTILEAVICFFLFGVGLLISSSLSKMSMY